MEGIDSFKRRRRRDGTQVSHRPAPVRCARPTQRIAPSLVADADAGDTPDGLADRTNNLAREARRAGPRAGRSLPVGEALDRGRSPTPSQNRPTRCLAGQSTTRRRTAGPSTATIPRPNPRRTRTRRRWNVMPRSPISRTASADDCSNVAPMGSGRRFGATPNRSFSKMRANAALVRDPSSKASVWMSSTGTRPYNFTLRTGPSQAMQASEMIE